MLGLLVMLSLKSFSQTVIQTETVDTTKVVLNVRVARLVYQDLLRYDGLKQEMDLMKLKFQKLEEREIQKDGIITILTQKDDNNQFIIGKKDEQLKLSKELTDSLHKELKGQRAKTFLWKVGTFTGLALTSLLLLSN
jgi:phosphotransferase system IIB component